MDSGRKRRRADASRYLLEKHGLEYAPSTLAKFAVVGGGPPYYKAGRIPLYADPDLDEWALAKLGPRIRSTSELAA